MKNLAARAAVVVTMFAAALMLARSSFAPVFAQTNDVRRTIPHHPTEATVGQGELLNIIRQSTARFKDVSVAQQEGYIPQFGCVSGSDAGAMGIHYVKGEFIQNPPLTPTGEIDPTRPQIVIYEPVPGGGRRLIGVDYVIVAASWDKDHPNNPPQLKGQLYHYFESPNRFGLPAFYTLHVWAWKENPNGPFVNWHPEVDCQAYSVLD
jgi:hypothetical protein